jgi:ferric-dicitrate binding protein FerR (iron transport regulator)
MGIQDHKLKELAARYKAGLCTAEEFKQIRQWYDEFETNGYPLPPENEIERASREAALAVIRQVAEKPQELSLSIAKTEPQFSEDSNSFIAPISKGKNHFIRYAAAAVILIFSSIGTYLYLKPNKQPVTLAQAAKKDFAPGGNKAVLTLSNGSQIILNNAKNGNLVQQGSTAVHKTNSGLVAYQVSPPALNTRGNHADYFNSITTPRGGQYRVILPDGTKVWLNSVSSIRFPVAFTGNDRKVEITGEVYFEVAHDKHKPFSVTSAGQTVTVLGTHFNIMAYPDEDNMVTTLLEGSVKIAKGKLSKTLKPGEQALVDDQIKVVTADTDDATAWKNGITSFTDADVKTIMRKISRWYDIDVEYQGPVSDRIFTGAISRKSNLSGLLKILNLNHIQFSIEGNKLIVK